MLPAYCCHDIHAFNAATADGGHSAAAYGAYGAAAYGTQGGNAYQSAWD